MKEILLITSLLTIWVFQVNAQNSVNLTINHKLAAADFALNEAAKNNMDHDFNITRLEYYISEISLVHDGGAETLIEDLWILANASNRTEVELGSHDITSVEKIKFYIGVDPDHNHLDPSTFHGSHPLAPKSPSMHWGWTAGYRFVALEGYGGSNFNQLIQLHGLGDNNYFETEVELDVTAENNVISIELYADYTRALENIAVSAGVIVHGDNLEARQTLVNFKDHVFSTSNVTSTTSEIDEVDYFSVYPNPVIDHQAVIRMDVSSKENYNLSISSLDGRQIRFIKSISDGQVIDMIDLHAGMYFINLIKEGQVIMTDKVIVK